MGFRLLAGRATKVKGLAQGSASLPMQNIAELLTNPAQLATDRHEAYLDPAEDAFASNMDYGI